jgi:DNA invertase Pin-like site-specific DNA recombinase
MSKKIQKAVAYLRTSSATNVGHDKDSALRQREAIAAYAKRAGFTIVEEFNDEAVSGADAIEARPGFAALLDRIEGNGVRVVLVEDASRFARHVLVQELGVTALQQRGVQVYTASGDELTATDDPSKVMVRQMMAAFAQFEKTRLVAKLAAARKRKREMIGKCEGRKGHAELRPDVVRLVKELRRAGAGRKPKSGVPSLRAIAAELAAHGHLNDRGRPYNPKSIAAMLSA